MATEARVRGAFLSENIPAEGKKIGFCLRNWKTPLNEEAIVAAAEYAYNTYGLTPIFVPIETPRDAVLGKSICDRLAVPGYACQNRLTVEELIGEPFRWNTNHLSRAQKKEKILQLMDTVGLAQRLINVYPHELDGGRRQRIGIARALALEPKMIICDEPVSALDVSVQAQVLNLLKELQKAYGIAYLFITHDLSVVNHFSDDIAVMYLGQIVEKAPAKELFNNPTHPYTKALLSAIPVPDVDAKWKQIPLMGEISSPINMKADCHFAARCPYANDKCRGCTPELKDRGAGHFVACHHF